MNTDFLNSKIWIIPNDALKEQLEDGKIYFFKGKLGCRHLTLFQEFFDTYRLPHPTRQNEIAYSIALSEMGFCSAINAGKFDGKYMMGICLPEQLTLKQILSFEMIKEILSNHCHSMLDTYVSNTGGTSYGTKYRDLKIEQKINRTNFDSITLLYNEIERQKNILSPKKVY